MVGIRKHTPRSPLCPTFAQSIVSEGRKLGARGGTHGSREVVGTPKIGPTGGRDPKTYPSISITPYLPLAPPHSPSPPEPLWAPKAPGASGSLGSLWKPLGALHLQSDTGALPPCSPSLCLTPLALTCPLRLPGALGPFWGLRKPWEPLEAFGSLGSSVRLRGLAFFATPHPSLPLAPPCP